MVSDHWSPGKLHNIDETAETVFASASSIMRNTQECNDTILPVPAEFPDSENQSVYSPNEEIFKQTERNSPAANNGQRPKFRIHGKWAEIIYPTTHVVYITSCPGHGPSQTTTATTM